jgi:hypothetical protein
MIYDNLEQFLGVSEKTEENRTHVFSIEPWGYLVYDYK